MKKKDLFGAAALFAAFALFTFLVSTCDVKPIGPSGASVGFATVNLQMFRLFGVHPLWHDITDGLGLLAMVFPFLFAFRGFLQLLRRKDLRKVDRSLLALGSTYLLLALSYLFFEQVIINFRPLILEGSPEASYPSSHTLAVVCIAATSAMEFRRLFPARKKLCLCVDITAALLSALTVIGRLLAGVHWFTDIVGGLLLAAALTAFYRAAAYDDAKKSRHSSE